VHTELDLSFSTVKPMPGGLLGAQQIAAYNTHGYLRPFDVFDEAEIAEIRSYVNRLMADMGPDGAYGINCYQARLAGLWDIATEPRILDLVQEIIGPNILCWATAVLSKPAHDPRSVPWHQDAAFWHLSPARTVTVWLAIDDVDAENAAMQFIPASHNQGKMRVKAAEENAVFHIEADLPRDLPPPVSNALSAGQISLHADMLVHGSQPNTSDRRRCGFTLRYCPPEVRIVDQNWAKGVEAILCRGTDTTGRWIHHPRPENDDITATQSPHVIGNN